MVRPYFLYNVVRQPVFSTRYETMRLAKTSTSFLVLLLFLGLTACSGIKSSGEGYTNPTTDSLSRTRDKDSIFGDDGLTFGGKSKDDSAGTSGIGVNGLLWRAALDTIAFLPLVSADPFGGVIITDWYAPSNDDGTPSSERVKLTVYILSQQLRADGIKVSAFKQIADKNGKWMDAAPDPSTAEKIENAILTRARELRVGTPGK